MKSFFKSLIFSDEDTSINYGKSQINSNVSYKPSLEDLYNKFLEDKDLIFSYDTSDCITFIMSNNSEMTLSNYSIYLSQATGKLYPVFLKISNKELRKYNNDILIGLPTSEPKFKPDGLLNGIQHMSTKTAANKNFSGFKNSEKIMSILKAKKLENFNTEIRTVVEAIEYCNNFRYTVGTKTYQGYLISFGQLTYIVKYADMINYILDFLHVRTINIRSDIWWTSTPYSAEYVWGISDTCRYKFCVHEKYRYANTLVLFKELNY